MNLEELERGIRTACIGRYEGAPWLGDHPLPGATGLPDAKILESKILRLRRAQRVGTREAGARTLLLARIDHIDQSRAALSWAADVRDHLGEREGTDLYLFLIPDHGEDAPRRKLETNEAFCRKFVVHQITDGSEEREESVEEFLARTFLGCSTVGPGQGRLADPLLAAMRDAAAKVGPWFTPDVQVAWAEVLRRGEAEAGEKLVKLTATALATRASS